MSQIETEKLAKLIADQLRPFYARWLKLRVAAAYSGIGKHRLIQLAESGKIQGFQDSDSGRHEWIFDKLSIDQYRENQAGQIKQKALALMGRKTI
jgi:hypothetical protein